MCDQNDPYSFNVGNETIFSFSNPWINFFLLHIFPHSCSGINLEWKKTGGLTSWFDNEGNRIQEE